MIDEKQSRDFKAACKVLVQNGHHVCAVVLERDFKYKTFQSIRAISGSDDEGLYCALQLLIDNFYEVLSSYDDPEIVEEIMAKAFEIGIKKAKERAAGAATPTALN